MGSGSWLSSRAARTMVPNLLLALASLMVLFAALELGARAVTDPVSPANLTPVPRHLLQPSGVPGLPFRLRPDAYAVHRFPSDPRGYFDEGATVVYQTNALGFRGPEVSLEKPPGTFRILGIGDSYTFGTGVHEEDTFLAVLRRALAARSRATRYEVVNLGLMGLGTVHEVRLLEALGLPLAPDLVVVTFVLNDAGKGAIHSRFNAPREPAWWRRSRLLDVFAERLARRAGARQLAADYRAAFRPDAEGWLRTREALDEMVALARAHDFELVLMIFPILWQLTDDHPFEAIHETIASAARERGIPVLDLLPAFTGHDGPELWVHPTNQHPNEVAHAIAAEELEAFLTGRHLPGAVARDPAP